MRAMAQVNDRDSEDDDRSKPDAGRLAASARASNRPNLATAKRSEVYEQAKEDDVAA